MTKQHLTKCQSTCALTRHRVQGTQGSKDISSLHYRKKKSRHPKFCFLCGRKGNRFSCKKSPVLTWGWLSRWRVGRPDGHNAAQTLWEPAAHASPAHTERQPCKGSYRWSTISGQSFFNNDARGF